VSRTESSLRPQVSAPVAPAGGRRVRGAVALNFLLSHLGMFAVLPILALYVRDQGGSATAVGVTLAAYAFTVRAAGVFTAGALSGVSDRTGSCLAMLTAGAGLAVLAAVPTAPLLPVLVLIALAINSNGLFIRCMLNRNTTPDQRTSAYALVSIAINVAAARGPFLGTMLYPDSWESPESW